MKKLITALYLPVYTLQGGVEKSDSNELLVVEKKYFSFQAFFTPHYFSFRTSCSILFVKDIQIIQHLVKKSFSAGVALLRHRFKLILLKVYFLWANLFRLPIVKTSSQEDARRRVIVVCGQGLLAAI